MQVPLFPLETVLFPGGMLPLRIFEPRYLSMVGNCMRNKTSFGVVLISEGREAGSVASFHEIGTLANIEDFDQLEDGHLGLSCRGKDRFNVVRHQVKPDQLITAEVEILVEKTEQPLPDEFSLMSEFVQNLSKREALKSWATALNPHWNNGEWLSCRLSELLPLSIESRQALLEMPYGERLQHLSRVMKENRMI